jgi:hypothetical protein
VEILLIYGGILGFQRAIIERWSPPGTLYSFKGGGAYWSYLWSVGYGYYPFKFPPDWCE